MKRILATVLSVALGFSLMVPAGALAANTDPLQTPDEITNLLDDIEAQKAANAPVPESLRMQKIDKLLEAEKLVAPEGVEAQVQEGNGVMFSGKAEQLTTGRFTLTDEFDFGEHTATRFSFDGLSEKGVKTTIAFFLDDEEFPFASIEMKRERGKVSGWKATGNMTIPIERAEGAAPVTGTHRVSFAIESIDKASNKNAKVLLRSFEFAIQTLPTLWFDIEGGDYAVSAMNNSGDKNDECYGSVTFQTPAGYECEYSDTSDLFTSGTLDLEYLRGRGNSTWDADKKPYKMKLASKANLFGMGKNAHWILLANRYDNSMMRNKATYWLGQQLGMEYTPECIFVDVVMNGTYYGSYYLCEQIRVGSTRVDIQDLEDSPNAIEGSKDKNGREIITGGYLLSADGWGTDGVDAQRFATSRTWGLYIESPSFEDHADAAREAQYSYIKSFVQRAEDAVYGKGFKGDDGTSYKELFDLQAAVDFFWIQGFSMNGDAWESGSNYLYKDRDAADGTVSKLKWGPLWDFDYVAWGNLDYGEGGGDNYGDFGDFGDYGDYGDFDDRKNRANGLDGEMGGDEGDNESPSYTVEGFETMQSAPWADRLLIDPEFIQSMLERWNSKLRPLIQELIRDGGMLDQYYEQLKVSEFYDDEIWGSYGESYVEDDEIEAPSITYRSYREEVDQYKGWISQRLDWVESNLSSIERKAVNVTFEVDGEIYETLEGLSGVSLNELPTPPKKDGYVFAGWSYTDEYGDEAFFDEGTPLPDENLTVKASWIEASKVKQPEAIFFPSADIYLSGENGDDGSEGRTIPCAVAPDDALYSQITWESSDPSVATVSSDGYVIPVGVGTTTITARLDNGVSGSFTLHVLDSGDESLSYPDSMHTNKSEIELAEGGYDILQVEYEPTPWYYSDIQWITFDPSVATVSDCGLVTAVAPGTTHILAIDESSGNYGFTKVTVTDKKTEPADNANPTDKSSDKSADAAKAKEVVINKAKVTKKVVAAAMKQANNLNATKVTLGKKVKKIAKSAFAGTKVKTIVLKTTKLKKKAVKGCFKKSKVKTVQVKVAKKKLKKTKKAYKKIFTKKNCGAKVKVK